MSIYQFASSERPGSEFDTRYLPAEPPPGPAIYDPPPPPPPAVYSKDSVIDADTLPELSTVPDGYKSNQPYIINTTHNTRPISELNRTISNEHHNETLLNQHISGKHFQKPVTTFSSPIFAPKPQPVVDWSGDYGVSDITTSHTVINERAVISSSSILVHDPPSPSLFNRFVEETLFHIYYLYYSIYSKFDS